MRTKSKKFSQGPLNAHPTGTCPALPATAERPLNGTETHCTDLYDFSISHPPPRSDCGLPIRHLLDLLVAAAGRADAAADALLTVLREFGALVGVPHSRPVCPPVAPAPAAAPRPRPFPLSAKPFLQKSYELLPHVPSTMSAVPPPLAPLPSPAGRCPRLRPWKGTPQVSSRPPDRPSDPSDPSPQVGTPPAVFPILERAARGLCLCRRSSTRGSGPGPFLRPRVPPPEGGGRGSSPASSQLGASDQLFSPSSGTPLPPPTSLW